MGRPGRLAHFIEDPLRLTAGEMRLLLADLDQRLRAREVAARIYVFGGAALALTGERQQLTPDIDAVVWAENDHVFLEAVGEMADDYALPRGWINSGGEPWLPPRPTWALERRTQPGLTVDTAPEDHLLAMKLVAFRPKDGPDIKRLIIDLGMVEAAPQEYADLLERVYAGEGALAQALGVGDGEEHQEAIYIGEAAVRLAGTIEHD